MDLDRRASLLVRLSSQFVLRPHVGAPLPLALTDGRGLVHVLVQHRDSAATGRLATVARQHHHHGCLDHGARAAHGPRPRRRATVNESTAVRREQLVQTEITLRSILGSLGKQTDQRSAERAAAGPAATPSEADGIAKISNELFTSEVPATGPPPACSHTNYDDRGLPLGQFS